MSRVTFNVTDQLRLDLTWWLDQLEHPIARKIWKLNDDRLQMWDAMTAIIDPAQPITIITDASSTGWGASLSTETLSGIWNDHQRTLSNNWRETRAIIHALKRWSYVQNERVLVLTDNSTAVAIVNARNTKAVGLVKLASDLTTIEQERGIQVVAVHIPGVLNDLPDALSRQRKTWTIALLSIDISHILRLGIAPTQIIGAAGEAMLPLKRYTPMPVPRNNFLIVVTTPDLPFLEVHLERWARQQTTLRGWIIAPLLPTRHFPIYNAIPLTITPPLVEGTATPWMLLQWTARGLHF